MIGCSELNHGSLGKRGGKYVYSEPCPHLVGWLLPATGQFFCRFHYRYHPRKSEMVSYQGLT